MNKDQIKGRIKEAKGTVKETAAHLRPFPISAWDFQPPGSTRRGLF